MMQWEQLLNLRKQGDSEKRLRIDQNETRLGFDVDYDRVIFSSAFRSLQDKTQVIPLSKTSFVHTRLTHSLEVSVVGRSLGRMVGKAILEKHPNLVKLGYQFNDFGAIVAAAALAHDIGNPPFGHSGEKAIGDYFLNGNGKRFKDALTDKEYQDLIDFEGNANGFKILTESKNGVQGGLRLTYATLGAFMKYPKESLPKKPTNDVCDKKFGVFQSEISFFNEVSQELGLVKRLQSQGYARHPLAYLVEAADDICYTIIDFEDGINLGLIPEDMALECLTHLVRNKLKNEVYWQLNTPQNRLAYLRSLAINTLVEEAASIFVENEEKILSGQYSKALLTHSRYEAQISDIIKVSVEKIYHSKEVREKEIAGYTILQTLLDTYTKAFENFQAGQDREYDRLLLKNISNQPELHDSVYFYLMACCSFISRLNDGSAVQCFKNIKGNIR